MDVAIILTQLRSLFVSRNKTSKNAPAIRTKGPVLKKQTLHKREPVAKQSSSAIKVRIPLELRKLQSYQRSHVPDNVKETEPEAQYYDKLEAEPDTSNKLVRLPVNKLDWIDKTVHYSFYLKRERGGKWYGSEIRWSKGTVTKVRGPKIFIQPESGEVFGQYLNKSTYGRHWFLEKDGTSTTDV